MSAATVRAMASGEELAVCALVDRVFDEFVAPDFGPEGLAEFRSYNQPDALAARREAGEAVLVAEEDGRIVGMVELRAFRHISMLFVEGRGRGLGRLLIDRALALCRDREPGLTTITVHAWHHAAPFYTHLGFRPLGGPRTERGISYVPMEIEFAADDLPERSV